MSTAAPIICAKCTREIIPPCTMQWEHPDIVYHQHCWGAVQAERIMSARMGVSSKHAPPADVKSPPGSHVVKHYAKQATENE